MTLAAYLPVIAELRALGKAEAAETYDALATIVTRASMIAAAVEAYEGKAAALVAVPYTEVLATIRAIEALLPTVIADIDYPIDLAAALRDVEAALFNLQTLRLAFASQASRTSGQSNVFRPTVAPQVPYRLRQGDTLERIARSTLGSVDRALEIVALNRLVYPYLETERDYVPAEFAPDEFDSTEFATAGTVDRAGVPAGVRVTGEVLWLPSDAILPAGQTLTDRDVELWGRDLRLQDGFLSLTDDGEAEVVAGRDNIVQALAQRIQTGRGELLLHPEYGMQTMLAVGIEGTRANIVLSGMEVARTVRQDPRVTAVRDVTTMFQDTVNTASMKVGLIGASDATLPLNLVLPESVIQQG